MTDYQLQVLQETEKFVRFLTEGESSGHDWWHIERVRKNTLIIGKEEGADLFICQMATLLHDVADHKFNESLEVGLAKVSRFLENFTLSADDKEHILSIIATMSFTSQKEGKVVPSLEGKVVQDADRLDALGAIGIARTMTYSGNKGRLIYHPTSDQETAIRHFDDKLLKLKDLMNTNYGKKLANDRHAFMETYLKQFQAEWHGER